MLIFYDDNGREIFSFDKDNQPKKPFLPQDLVNIGMKIDIVIVTDNHLKSVQKLLSVIKRVDGRAAFKNHMFVFVGEDARYIWYNWENWFVAQQGLK